MPCDTRLKPKQTISERAKEVREAVARITKLMATRQVRVVVDKSTGAVAFSGLSAADRDGVTDACAYRRIMAGTSAMAKADIARAEAMAGKRVNTQAIAQGVHSHDGGTTWHNGH